MLYLSLKRHFLTLPVGFNDDSLFAFKRSDCGRCGRTTDPLGRSTTIFWTWGLFKSFSSFFRFSFKPEPISLTT
jgi:hypothetical protein